MVYLAGQDLLIYRFYKILSIVLPSIRHNNDDLRRHNHCPIFEGSEQLN